MKVTLPLGWGVPAAKSLGLGDVGSEQVSLFADMLVGSRLAVRDGNHLAATLDYRQSTLTFNGVPAAQMMGLLGSFVGGAGNRASGASAAMRPSMPSR